MKFNGDREQFKELIEENGFSGQWIENNDKLIFKCNNEGQINLFNNGTIQFQGKGIGKQQLETIIIPLLNNYLSSPVNVKVEKVKEENNRYSFEMDNKKVFVVYGHDQSAREQLELILLKLNLDPFVLSNSSGHGLTIIEALEKEIIKGGDKCKFGIVLLTPDDIGYAKNLGSDSAEPRARQNVVLEMGMLLSALGRENVAILKKGHLEVPSDAQGILYIPFNDHIKETVPKLVDRFTRAGFDLKAENITRASS